MPYEEGRSWPAAAKERGGSRFRDQDGDLQGLLLFPGCFSSSFHLTLVQSLPCPDGFALFPHPSASWLSSQTFSSIMPESHAPRTWSGTTTDEPVVSCVLKEKKTLPLLYLYTILISFTALSVRSEWKLAAWWWWWWCLSAAYWCQLSCTDKMPYSQRAASKRQSAAFQDVDVKQKIKLQSPRAEFQDDEFPSTGTTTRLRQGRCQYISMLVLESIVGFCNTEAIHNVLHWKPTTGSLQLSATVVRVYPKNKNLRRSSTSLAVGFFLFWACKLSYKEFFRKIKIKNACNVGFQQQPDALPEY